MRSIVGIIFGALLIWAAGTGAPGAEGPQRLHDEGQKAQGRVSALQPVEHTEHRGGRRSSRTRQVTEMCPVVTWTLDGQQHSFTEHDDCDRLGVGDQVTVMYDADPSAARIGSEEVLERESNADVAAWIVRAAGVLFLVCSGLGLVRRLGALRAAARVKK